MWLLAMSAMLLCSVSPVHWIKNRNSPLYAAEVKNFLYRIVVLLL